MREDRYNIYRIDDVLIKVGYVFLVLFVLTGGTAVSAMVREGSIDQSDTLFMATASLFIPSAFFLLTGYHFRAKEQVAAAILHKMEAAREAPVPDLMKSIGRNRRSVERALLLINRRGLGYYVLDRGSDRIIDGRLQKKMVLVDRCDRCGSGISRSFPASREEPPQCPYCGTPVGLDRWNDMRNRVLEDIRDQDTRDPVPAGIGQVIPPAPGARRVFSLPVFILLLFIFWPAAVVYAVAKYNK